MNMGWAIFWLAMIVVAVVTEAATNQLVSIWFVLGGVAALISNLCGARFMYNGSCSLWFPALHSSVRGRL